MEQKNETHQGEGEMIECRVTPWYFKRMGMLMAMLVAFGAFFFYDWKWGYPKANEKAAIKERFDKEVLKGYDEAKKAGTLDAWREEMKKNNWPADTNGEPPKWLPYSAAQGLPEAPKRFTDKEIEEQVWWGGAMMLIAVVVGVLVLLNKGKVFRGYATHMIMPDGTKVVFADVFKIDKRKWGAKGLAYAWFRDGGEGAEKRVAIDCLKYDEKGAEAVLERLLSVFNGELIEKVEEPEDEEEEKPFEKPDA